MWVLSIITFCQAITIHRGKDHKELTKTIKAFWHFRKGVLVAMDVTPKGLDFPAIQHVINYDMPEESENYVHQTQDV